jgi:hypothetical protein
MGERYTLGFLGIGELRQAARDHGASAEESAAIDRLDQFEAKASDIALLERLANLAGVPWRELFPATIAAAERDEHWLSKIEALKPGDACEFHYPARSEWMPGVIVVNGGSGYGSVRDESVTEGQRGRVTGSLYIEMIRLPGQTEAWS